MGRKGPPDTIPRKRYNRVRTQRDDARRERDEAQAERDQIAAALEGTRQRLEDLAFDLTEAVRTRILETTHGRRRSC